MGNELTCTRGDVSVGDERFPKSARLTRRSEFMKLSKGGKKFHTPHFVVLSKKNDLGEARLGVTVSARVGKAIVRNRIKRLLREYFRRHRRDIPSAHDVVIIAKTGAGGLSLSETAGELRRAFSHQQQGRRS